MNSVLGQVASPTSSSKVVKATAKTTAETTQYMTFKLAEYLFAIPSQEILKVVATPPPNQGGMVSMGLVQLEQYSIQILDLPKLLGLLGRPQEQEKDGNFDLSNNHPNAAAQNPPFLIVMKDAREELWGIAVHEPPDLMDIPNYALKPVPSEKRLTKALRWVSHVVTYDLGSDRHTLLVLDLALLLTIKPNESSPSSATLLEIEPPIAPDDESARQEEMYA